MYFLVNSYILVKVDKTHSQDPKVKSQSRIYGGDWRSIEHVRSPDVSRLGDKPEDLEPVAPVADERRETKGDLSLKHIHSGSTQWLSHPRPFRLGEFVYSVFSQDHDSSCRIRGLCIRLVVTPWSARELRIAPVHLTYFMMETTTFRTRLRKFENVKAAQISCSRLTHA